MRPSLNSNMRITLNDEEFDLQTDPTYHNIVSDGSLPVEKFEEVTDLLLEHPNLNSTHLFRADILHDSAGLLETNQQKEQRLLRQNGAEDSQHPVKGDGGMSDEVISHSLAPLIDDVPPHRTVIRRLIPRNQNLDKSLDQSCYFYRLVDGARAVIYLPRADEDGMPWYHPKIRALVYLYTPPKRTTSFPSLSVHYALFRSEALGQAPERLHRTLLALLNTFLRLARYQPPTKSEPEASSHSSSTANTTTIATSTALDLRPSSLKDTVLPQHIVQDTYARLKTLYAPSLISAWVESTPPEKHVFEDLSIAAFLICLWQQMYGPQKTGWAGFVDLACGNGVLVWVLRQEGWTGHGIDARRRKTWSALDLDSNNAVREGIIVPQPFLDTLSGVHSQGDGWHTLLSTSDDDSETSPIPIHNGIFPPNTFLISNHADELSPWTPLLAALSASSSTSTALPFLAIPCCSHALSGAKRRYTPAETRLGHPTITSPPPAKPVLVNTPSTPANSTTTTSTVTSSDGHPSNPTKPTAGSNEDLKGDLNHLRATKSAQAAGTDDKSTYSCLTRKVVQFAQQLGLETTCTLMRIPSTRNVGIVFLGGLFAPMRQVTGGSGGGSDGSNGGSGIEPAGAEDAAAAVASTTEIGDDGAEYSTDTRVATEMRHGERERARERERPRKAPASSSAAAKKRQEATTIKAVIERECAWSGGVSRSAEAWLARARGVHAGSEGGRGRVNWGGPRQHSYTD